MNRMPLQKTFANGHVLDFRDWHWSFAGVPITDYDVLRWNKIYIDIETLPIRDDAHYGKQEGFKA